MPKRRNWKVAAAKLGAKNPKKRLTDKTGDTGPGDTTCIPNNSDYIDLDCQLELAGDTALLNNSVQLSLWAPNESAKYSLRAPNESAKYSLRAPNESAKYSLRAPNESAKYSLRAPNESAKYSLQAPNESAQSSLRVQNESAKLGLQSADESAKSSLHVQNEFAKSSKSSHCSDKSLKIIFGSHNQGDDRYSAFSRGSQCTCMSLSMIITALDSETFSSSYLDGVLYRGDNLYKKVLLDLMNEGKFRSKLLSLDELPRAVEYNNEHYRITKHTAVFGLPIIESFRSETFSMHEAIVLAFSKSNNLLVMIGSICSALIKKGNKYIFFDSHSHGTDGLSTFDGFAIIKIFSAIDDLVSFLYAFYNSAGIDLVSQFEILPVAVQKIVHGFLDCEARRCKSPTINPKATTETRENISNEKKNVSSKTNKRDYIRKYMRTKRQQKEFREKELSSKRMARQDEEFQRKEKVSKRITREDKVYRQIEKERGLSSKRIARQDPEYRQIETQSKRIAREDTVYRQIEKERELSSKRIARQDPEYRQIETQSKRIAREDTVYRQIEKERDLSRKPIARQDPEYRQIETQSKRIAREDTVYRQIEKERDLSSKRIARQDPEYRQIETQSKRIAREDTDYRQIEKERDLSSKRIARQNEEFQRKEKVSKRIAREDNAYREIEKERDLSSKHIARQDPEYRQIETQSKRIARQDPEYRQVEKTKELMSKRKAREDADFQRKEMVSKRIARCDEHYQQAEAKRDMKRKRDMRENPFIVESERLAKQQARQKDRQRDSERQLDKQRKTDMRRNAEYCAAELSMAIKKKYGSDINECTEKFHSVISTGPVYVCCCCHQTWFYESVSRVSEKLLKDCSNLLTDVEFRNRKWICNTCHTSLKKGKVPKLSVANGMRWPNKPDILNLYPLEERLISLRIPFMQIRELPRGGQYCVKGNVVNVPVDIQPTINVLPRPMVQDFTIPVKLKKKLSYKTCDFTENVRPKAVLSALHWLLSGSDLYRNSGIQVDESWIQTVSNDSREIVREFLHPRESNTGSGSSETIDLAVLDEERASDIQIASSNHSETRQQNESEDKGYESDNFSEVDVSENVSGNADTLLEDESVSTDRSYTFAPGENQHPLSLYADKDAEYLSFPSIFCGQRRPENEVREVPVHYSDIAKWELRSLDRRAAQSVPNIFFKLKKIQMKQISDKVHLAVRRYKTKGKKITAAEARDQSTLDRIVRLDEGYYIFRQLRNSPAYLASKKKDVFAMIRQLGLPTWFISLSSADTKWSDLLKALASLNDGTILSNEDVGKLTWNQKSKLIKKDPVTCSRFFDHRVQQFITTFLKSPHDPVGKMTDFFYRVEFQQRGSPHIHMLVWVENAPKYPKDPEEKIVQYVDKYTTCSHENENVKELVNVQTHKHSKTCRKQGKAVCRFGFPLPPLARTMILEPLETDVEEYKKKYDQMQEKINRYKEGLSLSYDQFLQEIVQMSEEEYIKCIRSSLNGPKLFLKRQPSEMRINLYNEHLLCAWDANIDMQFVLDPYACAMYIVSYISKSQRGMSALLDRACKEARQGNMDIKKQVRHIGNKFLNSVEVSAQEACYLVLQMPLTKASRDVIFINTSPPNERVLLLKQQSKLEELNPDSTDVHCKNIIERYSKRPKHLENWCLADYASQLQIKYPDNVGNQTSTEEVNEDALDTDDDDDSVEFSPDEILLTLKNGIVIRKRSHALILRYVHYSLKNDPENYFRERLLLFMPWRDEIVDLLNKCSSHKDHYQQKRCLIDNKAKQYEKNVEEIQQAMQAAEDEYAQHDELAPNAQQANAEDESEELGESNEYVHFNPDRPLEHRQYDIGADIGVTNSVPTVESRNERISDEQYLTLIRSLNIKQREFFNHTVQWIKTKDEPLYAFLSGGAGVGKSVLIKAIYQALHRHLYTVEGENPDDIRILLCAFTGKAAYNINGVTIASAFHKKYNQSNQSLSSDELNTFRMKYRNLSVIIIDEISMVGNKMLNFIDTRLKELTATNRPFGGISIIAVGDLYQLQPVGDSWIFNDLSNGHQILAVNLWKEHFKMFEMTQIMRQRDDLHFADLLNRLRTNNLTNEDKTEIQQHLISPADENYPRDVPHLFIENKFVDSYNQEFITKLSTLKVTVDSHDAIIADIPKANKERLLKNLPKDASKTANLLHSLTLAVGMIYDITVNLDVNDGLANGSTCIVKCIENRIPQTNRPSIVWVLFNDDTIGCATRQKYRHLYHSRVESAWTPIFEVNRNFLYNYKSYQRTQFPLKAAAAKTVHKAQGCTVEKVVVDLSQTRVRKTPHIHYVALSRVRKLENLKILNFNQEALTVDERVKTEMERLKDSASMSLNYVPLYTVETRRFKVAMNNARSLHRHFPDVAAEPNILAADVIGIVESRLCSTDEDATYLIEGFNIFRNDQEMQISNRRPYHGLVLYIKVQLECKRVVKYSNERFEFLLSDIDCPATGLIQVALIYKSPTCILAEFKRHIEENLQPHLDVRKPLMIIGDFNFDILKGNSEFLRFMEETFQCNQSVKKATTKTHSLLDLAFSNFPDVCTETIECYWSDHCIITVCQKY